MSNAIFPALPGLMWDVKRTPIWNTRVQRSVGGKEVRGAFYANPIWSYRLGYEFLRDSNAAQTGFQELQTLQAFFLQRQGSFDSFLWADPNDNAVAAHGFGVGDGTTTAFQLQRSYQGVNQQDYWSGLKTSQFTTPRTNLLLYSEDFTNAAWVNISCSVGKNTGLAPDGTPTATLLTATSAGGRVVQVLTAAFTGPYTLSIWAQAGAASSQHLTLYDNTGSVIIGQADFNLSTGAISGVTGLATIAKGQNGWWRCMITSTSMVGTGRSLWGYVYAGQGGLNDSTYVAKAQLEVGSVATPYIGPTTTAAQTVTPNYFPKSGDGFEPVYNLNPATPLQVWRNDWQGNQLMYQTARTNLQIQSAGFTSWAATNGTLTQNGSVAPDGTTTMTTLTDNATNGFHFSAGTAVAAASGAVLTTTVVLKPGTFTSAYASLNGVLANSVDVNLSTGVISRVGASVTASSITSLPNGTYRVSFTCPVPAANPVVQIGTGSLSAGYAGTSQTIFYWGVQVEAGAVATSYIPTTTTAVTQTDITVSSSGLVTFAVAPLPGAVLTWTGYYYWRVRFAQDAADFNNFMLGLWDLKALELVSLK